MNWNSKHIVFGLLILLIILLLSNHTVPLWDQDEAAYAGFAKSMVEHGEWVVPDFMWSDIHKKPPLHMWLIATCYKLFGINEFTTRLSSTLSVFFIFVLLIASGKKVFGQSIPFLSVMIVGSSLLVTTLGKIAFTDGLLLLFSTLCALSIIHVVLYKSFKWAVVFWISFALALLVKGPPIIIFTGLFGAILLFFHVKGKNILFLKPWFFFPLSLIPLFIWVYFVYLTGGEELINWLLDYYILQRVGGAVLGQTGPPGYYLISFIVFFIPFIMFIPGAVYNSFASIIKKRNSILFIVSAWFIAGWLIYELLPSKLPSYAVASHVPLGILIAIEYKKVTLSQKKFRYFNIGFIAHLILNISLCVGLFIVPSLLNIQHSFVFYVTGILYFNGILFIIYLKYKNQYQRMMYLMVINGVVLLLCLWGLVLPALNDLTGSTKRVAEYLEQHVNPETTIVISNKHGKPPSLPFYLEQRFSTIEECYRYPDLLEKINSNRPYALILTKKKADKLKDKMTYIDIKKISSLSTDRLDPKQYYIVLNKESKLKKAKQ